MQLCEEYGNENDQEQHKISCNGKRISILKNEDSKKEKVSYARVSFRKDLELET